MKLTITAFAMIMMTMTGCANEGIVDTVDYFEIETSYGSMVLRLYDGTPLHRDNFMKLVDEGFYDGTTFHRVMSNFMVQGGDPNSKDDDPTNDGAGGPGYTIPAEFNPAFYHKRGAIAAARQGDAVNPNRESSGSQFYIVHGQVFDPSMLDMVDQQNKEKFGGNFEFTDEAKEVYTTEGGTPFLDMDYTVFGELVEGFDVLDRLAGAETTPSQSFPANRPLTDISMTVRRLTGYSPK